VKIKNVPKYLLANATWDGLKIILGLILVASSSLFTSKILADTIKMLSSYRNYLSIITTSFLLLIFILVYQKFRKNKPIYPNLEFDCKILEKEITIDFSIRENIFYKKRIYLKSLINNLNAYHDKYHWTGSSENNVCSNIKGQTFQKTIKKNIFQFYEILFQHSLKKGDTVETELVWDLADNNNKMVPFISATIEEPTDLLIMNVSFPETMQIDSVFCEVSSSLGANKPFEVKKCELDRNKKATWRVRNPKLLFHYEMRWVF
jgi:hypothetical protein